MAEQLKIDVVLKNFASKELAVLDKSLTGFTRRGVLGFKNMAKSVFSLKGLLAGLGIGLAVRAVSRMVTETADAAAKIDDLSVSLGVSTEALSELEFAAKLSGAGLVDLETGFRDLQKGLGEFSITGRGVVRDVLDKLSPAFRQLVREGAPAEEVFKQVAREMENLSDAERVFVTSRLFGRGGTNLIKLLTGDMDGLTKQAHRLGLTLTKEMTTAAGAFNDSLAVMGAHTQGLKNQLVLGLLPALNEFLKFLIESDTKGRPAMLRFLAEVIRAIGFMGDVLSKLGAGVSTTIGTFKKLFIEVKILRLEWEALSAAARLPVSFIELGQIQVDLKKLRNELATIGDETEDSADAWRALGDAIATAGNKGADGVSALADELNELGPSTTANLKAYQDAIKGITVEARHAKQALEQIPTVTTPAMFEATNAIAGAGRAFKDLGQASREWGVAANQAVHAVADSIADNVTDGLMAMIDGTKSAKEAFADMARGILKDIAQIIIKTLVLKAVQGAFGQVGFATGGIVPGHIEPVRGHLARGGVVRRRGLFEIGEGGQHEAVVPLVGNRAIPVDLRGKGGRGGGGAPVVNIYLNYNSQALTQKQQSALIEGQAKTIAQVVGNEIRQSPAIREAFRAA